MSVPIVTGVLTGLDFVATLVGRVFRTSKTSSLVNFTKSTRVEPVTLIDRRLLPVSYLGDIMQSASSIFSGYYLQAVAVLTHVNSVNVVRALDSLNPSRDVVDATSAYLVDRVRTKPGQMSSESYALRLPALNTAIPSTESYALENAISFEEKEQIGHAPLDERHRSTVTGRILAENGADAAADYNRSHTGVYHDRKLEAAVKDVPIDLNVKDNIKIINEAVNLSVGKLLSVEIGDSKSRATFPIMVRLIATFVDPGILTHILGDGSRNLTAKERYHAWRSGQLKFWRDLVFCQDLIDEHKAALMKDDSGAYAEIRARSAKNRLTSTLTDTPSIGDAANLLIVSKQTIKDVEREVGGSFDNEAFRNKVFHNSRLMIVFVVDADNELVKIYTRDLKLPTTLSVRELKVSNKGTGPDVAEVMKAYILGSQVSI